MKTDEIDLVEDIEQNATDAQDGIYYSKKRIEEIPFLVKEAKNSEDYKQDGAPQ